MDIQQVVEMKVLASSIMRNCDAILNEFQTQSEASKLDKAINDTEKKSDRKS